jgi:CPA1 family monovalent cation:H+ antiporter
MADDLCEHLKKATDARAAKTPDGCEECLKEGTPWIALRMCLTCGHVGCCDSSIGRHATKHFQATGHPVMAEFPGKKWKWCYVDKAYG